MNKEKRKKLEAKGYKVTDTQEFLGLSDEQMAIIDKGIKQSAEGINGRK